MKLPKKKAPLIVVLGLIALIFCFSLPLVFSSKAPSASLELAPIRFVGEQAKVFMRGSETGAGGLYHLRAEARGTIRNVTGDWLILEARDEYVLCAKANILKVVIEK